VELLRNVTRQASRVSENVTWNELAPTDLALRSGIAKARNREDFDRVNLNSKCFRTCPLELTCLDGTTSSYVDVRKSRFMPPMPWLAQRPRSSLGSRVRPASSAATKSAKNVPDDFDRTVTSLRSVGALPRPRRFPNPLRVLHRKIGPRRRKALRATRPFWRWRKRRR